MEEDKINKRARFGGIQHLKFIGKDVERMPLTPPPSFARWLEKHLILANTGIKHTSGDLHSEVWERYDEVLPYLMEIRQSGRDMADAVQNDDRFGVCKIMNQYRDSVGKLNPELNAPYELLSELSEVLAWKGWVLVLVVLLESFRRTQRKQNQIFLGK